MKQRHSVCGSAEKRISLRRLAFFGPELYEEVAIFSHLPVGSIVGLTKVTHFKALTVDLRFTQG
jgi:hypothetical protein